MEVARASCIKTYGEELEWEFRNGMLVSEVAQQGLAFAAQPDNLRSTLGTHVVERESHLEIVLCASDVHSGRRVPTHKVKRSRGPEAWSPAAVPPFASVTCPLSLWAVVS